MSSSSLSFDPLTVAWSVPESDRDEALRSRPLLVLLHGRGSHEQDLFSLVPLLPQEAVIASVRAPLTLNPGSFTWFPVGEPGRPSAVAADAAALALLEWLDSVAPSGRVALLGFSQGGALALQAMRQAPGRFAAIVCLAGFVVPGDDQRDEELLSLRPAVFWGRDPADPVLPTDAVERTSAWLPSHSTLTGTEYPGIGHSISREELDDVAAFLGTTLLA